MAGDALQQARGRVQLLRVDAGVQAVALVARAQRHHQLFHRGIAGALADAVDRALDLAGAAFDRRQRVGHGEAQVVVAVRAEDHRMLADHLARRRANKARISSGVL
jgi:hypothetical protein